MRSRIVHASCAIGRNDAKARFIDALRLKYTVMHAARAAGVGRRTCYDWREQDAEFAAAWDDARQDAIEALETSNTRRR